LEKNQKFLGVHVLCREKRRFSAFIEVFGSPERLQLNNIFLFGRDFSVNSMGNQCGFLNNAICFGWLLSFSGIG